MRRPPVSHPSGCRSHRPAQHHSAQSQADMSRQGPRVFARQISFWPKTLPNRWNPRSRGWRGGRLARSPSCDNASSVDTPSRTTKSIWKAARPVELDANGTLVSSWGGPGNGYDWPQLEHGIYIDDNDNVWLGAGGCAHPEVHARREVPDEIGKPGKAKAGATTRQIWARGKHHHRQRARTSSMWRTGM